MAIKASEAAGGRLPAMNSAHPPRTLQRRAALAGCLFAAAGLLSACITVAGPPQVVDEAVMRGASYATANCAGCHAIGATGESVYRAAPAFRNLRASWSSVALELRLSRAVGRQHYGMPPRILTPSESHDLAAFIQNQRQPDPAKRLQLRTPPCIGLAWC